MATIDRFADRIHAEVACSLLVAHGFDARVLTDADGGSLELGTGSTAILLPDDQYDDAVAMLDEQPPKPVEPQPVRRRRGLRTAGIVVLAVVVATIAANVIATLLG